MGASTSPVLVLSDFFLLSDCDWDEVVDSFAGRRAGDLSGLLVLAGALVLLDFNNSGRAARSELSVLSVFLFFGEDALPVDWYDSAALSEVDTFVNLPDGEYVDAGIGFLTAPITCFFRGFEPYKENNGLFRMRSNEVFLGRIPEIQSSCPSIYVLENRNLVIN